MLKKKKKSKSVFRSFFEESRHFTIDLQPPSPIAVHERVQTEKPQSCHLLENLLPNVISQLVLVEMRTPGMGCQMIGNKVVNALSQILVGRLESNDREGGWTGGL